MPARKPPRVSNAALARIFLLVMLFMAVVGLTFALMTVNFRRENDNRNKNLPQVYSPGKYEVEAVDPVDLAALGYLPQDSCLVCGVHLAQMGAHPDGKKLLDQLQEQNLILGLDRLQQWLGLKPEDIDHFAVGMRPDDFVTGFTLVVRTRKPYTQEKLAKVLHPAKPTLNEGKPVYRLQQQTPKRMIWCPDDKTLVVRVHLIGVEVDDLKTLPLKPNTGAAGLAEPIRHVLVKNLKESFLWSAGDLSRIKGLAGILFLTPKIPPELKTLLPRVDTFAAGLRFYKGITLNASFQARDVDTARELHALFKKPAPKDMIYKVEGPLSEPPPTNPEDQRWVLVQVQATLERAMQALQKPESLLPK